jgi:hypothetical protein
MEFLCTVVNKTEYIRSLKKLILCLMHRKIFPCGSVEKVEQLWPDQGFCIAR